MVLLNEMDRTEIIKRLAAYHQKQGIAFLSHKDSVNYFRGLVELIEHIIEDQSVAIPMSFKN